MVALGVRIEPLDRGDLLAYAQCLALDATVFPHVSLPWLGTNAEPTVWIARAAPDAERGSYVVGFAATSARGAGIEVVGLAVDEPSRGGGIGEALLRAVIEVAREKKRPFVALHVSTGNHVALRLYERLGFRVIHRLRHYYRARTFPDGGDAFYLVLPLG